MDEEADAVVVGDCADAGGVGESGAAGVNQLDAEPLVILGHIVGYGSHPDDLAGLPADEVEGHPYQRSLVILVRRAGGGIFGHPIDGEVLLGGLRQGDGKFQVRALYRRSIADGHPGAGVVVADGGYRHRVEEGGSGHRRCHHHPELLLVLVNGVLEGRDQQQWRRGFARRYGDRLGGDGLVVAAGLGRPRVAGADAAVFGFPGKGHVLGGDWVHFRLELKDAALGHLGPQRRHRQCRAVHDAHAGVHAQGNRVAFAVPGAEQFLQFRGGGAGEGRGAADRDVKGLCRFVHRVGNGGHAGAGAGLPAGDVEGQGSLLEIGAGGSRAGAAAADGIGGKGHVVGNWPGHGQGKESGFTLAHEGLVLHDGHAELFVVVVNHSGDFDVAAGA